jgi:hypothetical protein
MNARRDAEEEEEEENSSLPLVDTFPLGDTCEMAGKRIRL